MPMPSKPNKDKSPDSKEAPELRPGTPLKPKGLSERASQEWDRLAGELAEAGLLITVAHRAALQYAATIAADIATDWAEIQKEGAYTVSAKGGIVAHPAVKRMDALRRDAAKFLALLGLRAAVSSGPTAEQDLEDVLNS